ncbi:MAG: DUF2934 domain-containing protein [Chthoniobacterales bacterium]
MSKKSKKGTASAAKKSAEKEAKKAAKAAKIAKTEKSEKTEKPAKTTRVAKRPATRKRGVKAPAKASKKRVPKTSKEVTKTYTVEDIQLRAYFIAERRQSMGWPGNEESDWVEAERQLIQEAKRK